MTDGKVTRLFLLLQTAHHYAAFKRTCNQGSQFRRIDIATDLASSLPLLGNGLQTIKQGTESLAGFGAQLRIAIVGIDGRVQQRAAARHQPAAPVAKVPHDLFETINGIRDLLCSFEARIHCNFPSVVEGVSRKLFFALKVSVNPTLFQTSGSHEIGKCSAIVSFLIEDWRCLTNDVLPRLLAFAHVATPREADSATVPSLISHCTKVWMRPSGPRMRAKIQSYFRRRLAHRECGVPYNNLQGL